MKSLFLVSGGLDSTSGMYKFRDMEYDCVTVNYGQRAYREQVRYARLNCDKLNKKLIEINIKELGLAFRHGKTMIPHEPIKHRNAAIIPLMLVYASEMGYSQVYVFTVSEECVYESNKPEILKLLTAMAKALHVELVFPFLGLSKSYVLKIGVSSGMNPVDTYSCIVGHKRHCGRCSQCEMRKIAFLQAGIKDETSYLY